MEGLLKLIETKDAAAEERIRALAVHELENILQTEKGDTLLTWAARHGNDACLLEMGASAPLRAPLVAKSGSTPSGRMRRRPRRLRDNPDRGEGGGGREG